MLAFSKLLPGSPPAADIHVTSKYLPRQQGAGTLGRRVIKEVMSGLFKGDMPKAWLKGQIFCKPDG